jgi:hypothetical protein
MVDFYKDTLGMDIENDKFGRDSIKKQAEDLSGEGTEAIAIGEATTIARIKSDITKAEKDGDAEKVKALKEKLIKTTFDFYKKYGVDPTDSGDDKDKAKLDSFLEQVRTEFIIGKNTKNKPEKVEDFIVNKDGITKYNKDDLLIGGTNLFGDKKTKTTDNFKNSMKEAWSELIKGGGELFNPVEAKKETLAMYERITSLIQKTITDRKRDETRNDMQLINTNIFGGDSGSGKPSEIFVPVELDFVRY